MKFLKKIICSILSIALLSSVTTYAAEPFALQKALNPIVRMLESRNSVMPMSDNIIESGYCGGEGDGTNLTWTLTSDGILTISGKGPMQNPCEVFRYPFYAKVKGLVLNDGITSIGDRAFASCQMTSVIIPDSVTKIGDQAFYLCRDLTDIKLSDNLEIIGINAFSGCNGLTHITIPDSVKSMGSDTFARCTKLSNVTISDGVSALGAYTFSGCSALELINIPHSVRYMPSSVFQNCTALKSIIIDKADGTLSDSPWSATNANITYLRKINIAQIEDQYYAGKAIKPDMTITEDRIDGSASDVLQESLYNISYENNINAGEALVHLTLVPDCSKSVETTFNILPKSADNLRVDYIPDEIFTGTAIMPPVIVTDTERSN